MAVAVLVIASAYYELNQSKKEMLQLMSNEAHSLLETVLVSSQEVLYASDEVEGEIQTRLLNNANTIKVLLESGKLNNSILNRIANENKIPRIFVFNKNAEKIFSNSNTKVPPPASKAYTWENLNPIFNNETDTLIIGFKKARGGNGFRYVVALASSNDDAIVLNLDAEELLKFKRRVGFGVLIKRLTENEDVLYTVLESFDGILAASGKIEGLDNINESQFLYNAIEDSAYAWRITKFNDNDFFEAVHPFALEGNIIGLYRIGLSLNPLNVINERLTVRIIIIAIFLFLLGSVMLVLLFVIQNLDVAKKQYHSIETYSNKLIKSVSDVIIVVDNKTIVKEMNEAALNLFNLEYESSIGQKINTLINDDIFEKIFLTTNSVNQITCDIAGETKQLLISKSLFVDGNEIENSVLIIKDLTEIKKLESQIARSEQMNAMGHLASGVAHEIRNPLNSIATIVQQLDKDFEPTDNKEEFHSLAGIVYKEVRRMNETIENFLKFSRPEPITKMEFNLSELITSLEIQYKALLKEKSIELIIEQNWDGKVNWDRSKIKQALINLVQNSIEAIGENGTIRININDKAKNVIIKVNDTGSGIPKENLKKIFNLYYTTKASGTGIGLGIIQRIISEHDGIVIAESEENIGTEFIITIPKN